jgi:predicted RecA/RadA family phage recombinase
MKRLVTVLLTALALSAQTQIPITQSRIVVNSGEQVQFTHTDTVTWSLAAGSEGSITSGGVYTAPAVVAKHYAHGCQILPNDHIYNQRVDGLDVHPDSAAMIAQQGDALKVSFPNHGFPLNVKSGPVAEELFPHFRYTHYMNGSTLWWFPEQQSQNGRDRLLGGIDRHVFTMDRDTCEQQEMYQYYRGNPSSDALLGCAQGETGVSAATCKAASASQWNSLTQYLPMSPYLSGGGAHDEIKGYTDATGTLIVATALKQDEMEDAMFRGGSINHMLAFAMPNGYHNTAASPRWPAVAAAGPYGGLTPYGSIMRLKSTYTYAGSNPLVAAIITALKQYGMLDADGSNTGVYEMRFEETATLPPAIRDALKEFDTLDIGKENFDVVDASPLMIDNNSGIVKVPNSKGIVPDGYVEVIATRVSDSVEVARKRIMLRGITVGVESVREYVQAGAAPFQVPAWVNGTANTALTYAMDPAVSGASITTDGVLTPPPTLTTPTPTRITATSAADPTKSTSALYMFLPSGTMRFGSYVGLIDNGTVNNFTDSGGNVWWTRIDYGGNKEQVMPTNAWLRNWGNWGTDSDPDYQLYRWQTQTYHDGRIRAHVANGTYRITVKTQESNGCLETSPYVPCTYAFETNDGRFYTDLDVRGRAGSRYGRLDIQMPATVTDGILRWNGLAINAHATGQFKFSSLMIEPVAEPTVSMVIDDPAHTGTTLWGIPRQLYATPWFSSSASSTWSLISGPGSITSGGLYTPPTPPQTGSVTVRATLVENPSITADRTFSIDWGTLSVSPATPIVQRGANTTFAALLNGISFPYVTWSRSPAVGNLNATTGAYYAPPRLSSDATTTITATPAADATKAQSTTVTVPAVPAPVRINAGGICSPATVTDGSEVWLPDTGFISGTYGSGSRTDSISITGATAGQTPLYRCDRNASAGNAFTYSATLPQGVYSVKLKWAEHRASAPAQPWNFHVDINGVRKLTNFNHVTAAGGVRTAYDQTFTDITVPNGTTPLTITFTGVSGSGAAISAVEVTYVRPVPQTEISGSFAGIVQ